MHGGPDLTGATVIDENVLAEIKALTDLAPLHQPRALAGIAAARALLPQVPQVACFDTAFHASLPPAAARAYALPAALDRPLRPAPVRLPRPVAQLRGPPLRSAPGKGSADSCAW